MAERKLLATSGEDMDLLMSYMDGYRATLAISAACDLELFDKVNQSPEGVMAATLAEENGWNEDATCRLLNACVALKTLHKFTRPDGYEIYQLAGPGQYLRKNSDPTIWEATASWAKRMFGAMSKLPDEVRTAKNKTVAFPPQVTVHKSLGEHQGHAHDAGGRDEHHGDHDSHSHGHSHEGGHHHGHGHGHSHGHGHGHSHGHGHKRNPEEMLLRLRSMGGAMQPYLKDLLKAFDLSKYTTAVDLGAGGGALTFELCRLYPAMSVTFFDVPPVTSLVQEHLTPTEEKLNVTFVAGDFFEVDLPKADLYVLSKIIHDWNPEQAATLLKKVYDATNTGGGVILMEKCMNDAKDGPASAHLFDLMVMSFCGGTQRSGAEYAGLLQAAGYKNVQIGVTSESCPYDVVMATRP